MSAAVWNGPNDVVVTANGGTNSTPFSMPNNALGVLLFIPTITGTVKIQSFKPADDDLQDVGTAGNWQDLSTILTGGTAVTFSTVSALASATAYGFDAGVLGAGVFRFVSSGAEGAERTFRISWRVDASRD